MREIRYAKKFFIKMFFDSNIEHYAASLSFYTILSIIPLLLISFWIFPNVAIFQDSYIDIKNFILSNLVPTDLGLFMDYLDSFIENSLQSGVYGTVYIIITSLGFFWNYEYIVSQIFKEETKSFWDAFATYWTLLTLTPFALIVYFYISGEFQRVLEKTTIGVEIFTFIPYLIIWALFFVVYKISINTKITLKSILISSFVSSFFWFLAKIGFLYYIIFNKTYTTIYGSFSAILIFFVWIYISWIIFLYGIKLCYLIENYKIELGEEGA